MGKAHAIQVPDRSGELPPWVPEPVRAYLAHTEGGATIRALARAAGCHPSTVLRQVRRTETLRDDPLSDAGLARLGQLWRDRRSAPHSATAISQDPLPMTTQTPQDDSAYDRETLRVLRALTESRTLLVIADGVEDAVVVHDAGGDRPVRRAVVGRALAEALALRRFIEGQQTGRLARYTITAAGRAEAGRLMAAGESRRAALATLPAAVDGEEDAAPAEAGRRIGQSGAPRRSAGTDAPFHVLARRRRADGGPWLPPELIATAQRFQETWEIARLGGGLTRDWDRLVSGQASVSRRPSPSSGGPTRRLEAERSLAAAIRALGPDLAETVLLGVCHELGMEDIEQKLDFPARSGKIVMRIALRSLARHYAAIGSEGYDMIS